MQKKITDSSEASAADNISIGFLGITKKWIGVWALMSWNATHYNKTHYKKYYVIIIKIYITNIKNIIFDIINNLH